VSGFAELGLRAELCDAAAARFDAPTPIQRAAIPVLRRGGNALLLAASGSGITVGYALALLDRLSRLLAEAGAAGAPRGGSAGPSAAASADGIMRPRALIITATEDRAAAVAHTFATLGAGLDVPVRALTVAWSSRGAEGVLVAPLDAAVRALRESSLKLDQLVAMVFDHAAALLELGEAGEFEGLGASLPPDAQRIITTPAWTKAIERFAEANARRALTIPPRLADPAAAPPTVKIGTLSYLVVTAAEKPAALARVLRRSRTAPPLITMRSTARAQSMAGEMRARGFVIGQAPAPGVDAEIVAPGEATDTPLIAGDVPFDATALAAMNLTDGLVLVEPAEQPHLRAMALEAGIELKALGTRAARGSVALYRERIREAIREQDLDAQLELLGPLFDEFAAAEVAAALSALLRARPPAQPAPAETEAVAERPQAFVRLFVSAGHKDNIRPGDLVGAITGEAGVKGEQVGRIEIRDTFSVVEVAADVSERVLRALNGTTLRGRALRVDYDRKTSPGPHAPRRTQRASGPAHGNTP
jgi:ATP-dependent RNA helicase DeaD